MSEKHTATPWDSVNSRYAAYCKSQGAKSPNEMLATDRKRYPGGLMAGYMIWIGEKLSEFKRANGIHVFDSLNAQKHAEFDALLSAESAA